MIDDEELERFVREEDLLTSAGLREAHDLKESEGRPLYDVLLDHNLVAEKPLVEFVSKTLNVSLVDPDDFDPDSDVIEHIPRSVAFEEWVIPVDVEDVDGRERLVLAMRNPIDMAAMDAVANHIDADIRPLLAGPNWLKDALRDAYGPEDDQFNLSSMNFSSDVDGPPIFDPASDDATQFGKPGPPEDVFDDPGETSVHDAQTVEAQSDELQERVAEIDAEFESNPDAGVGSATGTEPDPTRKTHIGGNERAQLVERLASAADGLEENHRDTLESHSETEILTAAVVALVQKDLLSIDELLEALTVS